MTDFSLKREFERKVKQTLDGQEQTIVQVLKEREALKTKMNQQKGKIIFKITLSEKNNIQPYTTTKIKSGDFLLNISYGGINKEDFYNRNVVFDVYSLITKT